MSRVWFYAVVITLIATAILEQTCGNSKEQFNPLIDHSEIKAHFVETERYDTKWIYLKGEAYGHLFPVIDTLLVEDY